MNIHNIISELWGDRIAKPGDNSVSNLGAFFVHDIFMTVWFSKLLFIHTTELAIHASVKNSLGFSAV